MNRTLRGKVAIVGVGQSPSGRVPGRSPLDLTADATLKALADAGMNKSEIDGVLTGTSFASSFHRFSVALSEYLNIQPSYSNTLQVSGATAAAAVNTAAAAISAGLADTVLVACGDSLLTGMTPDLAIRAMTESRDQQYEMPFGIPVANTFAMTAHRHMKEFGTTPEQLAKVAVTFREHAARTPGAQKTDPITIDDVLNSKMVTTPYHKLDCSLISDGGVALILTSAERAYDYAQDPIFILGGGEYYSHEHIFLMPELTQTGAVQSAKKAYQMAGISAKDIDVAGIYDCFTGTLLMMLEDLGFCKKGEAGPFVEAGEITYGGSIPTNTHGGMLSYAHPGIPAAWYHFAEVTKQLRHSCGERQVPGAELGLVHALGAGFSTQATTILGRESTL
ncbi:MAG: thiolase [Piscirickettsiaceae bacterium]|nr:MAG: thiolase [Piscirickettsiaceae bacterium]PCI68826.1 MAG: thiolase [Piscirickettsiaceae bacterium]